MAGWPSFLHTGGLDDFMGGGDRLVQEGLRNRNGDELRYL